MTQVWFRNPHNYIRELVEVGEPPRIVWDRGMLVKKRIDPVQHAKLYFGEHANFEILCVGTQGTAHLDKDHNLDRPKAVYPTWEYGENFNILEEMVSNPIGFDADACSAPLPLDERPVVGQPHIVVVTNLPNAQVGANRPFYRNLRDLQEEYSDCILLLHGSYSYRVMFGMGFGAADVDPRTDAANGKVNLPNGKTLAYARTVGQLQWVNLLGMSVTDLKVPNKRCIFNIKSALWAGENFMTNLKFKTRGATTVDPNAPMSIMPVTKKFRTGNIAAQEGDMIVCDSCSLSDECKLYREGAVCSVQGSETSSLANMFKSRDGSLIIDALGTVLAAQTDRLQRGMESEEEFGELDPEVTKMMNSIFGNGIKLAKLVDPSLAKPQVVINNGTAAAVAGASPQEIASKVVRALEAQGIKRQDITPDMFENMLRQMTGVQELPKAVND